MKDIEESLAAELKSDSTLAFKTSDDELFKRAAVTANNQQGTKDLVALGMASIWVVFISLFMKILKPLFKRMAGKPKALSDDEKNIKYTTNNENK